MQCAGSPNLSMARMTTDTVRWTMRTIAENSIWSEYKLAVQSLEFAGMCRSDAQDSIRLEFDAFYGKGWDNGREKC